MYPVAFQLLQYKLCRGEDVNRTENGSTMDHIIGHLKMSKEIDGINK